MNNKRNICKKKDDETLTPDWIRVNIFELYGVRWNEIQDNVTQSKHSGSIEATMLRYHKHFGIQAAYFDSCSVGSGQHAKHFCVTRRSLQTKWSPVCRCQMWNGSSFTTSSRAVIMRTAQQTATLASHWLIFPCYSNWTIFRQTLLRSVCAICSATEAKKTICLCRQFTRYISLNHFVFSYIYILTTK